MGQSPIATSTTYMYANARRCDVSVVDEHKIDQVISELGRYQASVVVLQETKWFWNAL